MLNKSKIEVFFRNLQDKICTGLEEEDGKAKFIEDLWVREEGGGGRTRVIQNGNVFEKGGVNFSAVYGPCPDFLKKEAGIGDSNVEFFATGISIVIHPLHPFVPIIHMNVRYFEAGNVKWFGGGIDLTPHYIEAVDTRFFHTELKKICDLHNATYYPEFKKWADEYFYIKHRGETRGVGGIFFDRLSATSEISIEKRYEFVKAVGETFLAVYLPLVKKNRIRSFTPENRHWQLLRRGRYAEFNLVYDRGTKFGLQTDGRVESILMSLPPITHWEYNFIPLAGSPEAKTIEVLKSPVTWV